jgi:hypothetical protein
LPLRLSVELGDHPVELVERAAEALTILLREFRPLRADDREKKADRDSEPTGDHSAPPKRSKP